MVSVLCYNAFMLYRFILFIVFIVFLVQYFKNRREFTVLFNSKIKFNFNIMLFVIYCILFSINLTPVQKQKKSLNKISAFGYILFKFHPFEP